MKTTMKLFTAMLVICIFCQAKAQKMEKLVTDLPRPMFVGTPKNFSTKVNLDEANFGKPRPPFYIPQGVSNVANGMLVTSSELDPIIGSLEQITDGDKEGGDGSYVELGFDVQWIQIDLEDQYEIYAILLWHFHMQGRVYRDVIIQVSDDEDFTSGVTTLFNNDDDNSAELGIGKDFEYVDTYEGFLVDAKGLVGRYLKLYSNGNTSNDMNHYIEVEVFGRPAI
jgi:hypothetical protein